ncbi:hypothetical protein LTR27_009972 [Elasticomyces elasticus]|nr:hypothetical protein LTR27_009972 [Elasticomyces elasticus]
MAEHSDRSHKSGNIAVGFPLLEGVVDAEAEIDVGGAGTCVEAAESSTVELWDTAACSVDGETFDEAVVGVVETSVGDTDAVVDVVVAGVDDSVDDVGDVEAEVVDDSADDVVERLSILPCTN